MHSPSPQLLRALRTSISPPTLRPSSTLLGNTHLPTIVPRRYNSTNNGSNNNNSNNTPSRPSRMIPRAHTPKPTTTDRGPTSTEETQTDFGSLNVLGSAPAPTTAIDTCLSRGFQFNNGVAVVNGDGVMLVSGEAFAWKPWLGTPTGSGTMGKGDENKTMAMKREMVNSRGQLEVDQRVWGLLSVVWPRPDLLIVGTGASILPLSLETKKHINSHGIRVEVLDTRNAAAQFNLLATERGVTDIAAALIPIGWEGRRI